jgi:hypothetical protein
VTVIRAARDWLFTPRGALVYFCTAYAAAAVLLLAFSGCRNEAGVICLETEAQVAHDHKSCQ